MRARLSTATRIVVKLGTQVVTRDGGEFALGRVTQIVEHIAAEQRAGRQLLLVSSGSIGLGVKVLGLSERPRSLGMRQACAAAGQGQLIALYAQAFSQLGVKVAQVLLTQEDLADPDRALCLRTTLSRLLDLGVIPILNENDSVSVRELLEWRDPEELENKEGGFGDNDGLSARVATAIDADLLVLLTDVDGVYTANPKTDPEAQRLSTMTIDDAWKVEVQGASKGGTGGMASKIEAARIATDAGVDVLIARGLDADTLPRALAGEDLGTLISAPERRSERRRRVMHGGHVPGALILNSGAVEAITQRKASLLPIGVERIEGDFARGDIVELRDGGGRVWGRGFVNYDARACRMLVGQHSEAIFDILGYRGYDTLVTRDNLFLAEI